MLIPSYPNPWRRALIFLLLHSCLGHLFSSWVGGIPGSAFGVNALEVNATFDDASTGDGTASITYIPFDGWSEGQNCPGCHAQPDRAQVKDGTWHDTTFDTERNTTQHSIVFNFVGTALYVYCVMANTVPGPGETGTHSSFSFLMDGTPSGPNFTHTPSSSTDYDYNVLVYNQSGLSNEPHTFTLNLNGGPGVNGSSLILFDYIEYTKLIADTPPSSLAPINPISTNSPSISSASPTASSTIPPPQSDDRLSAGLIAGVTIACVIGILISAILIYLCIKEKKKITKLTPASNTKPSLLPLFLDTDTKAQMFQPSGSESTIIGTNSGWNKGKNLKHLQVDVERTDNTSTARDDVSEVVTLAPTNYSFVTPLSPVAPYSWRNSRAARNAMLQQEVQELRNELLVLRARHENRNRNRSRRSRATGGGRHASTNDAPPQYASPFG